MIQKAECEMQQEQKKRGSAPNVQMSKKASGRKLLRSQGMDQSLEVGEWGVIHAKGTEQVDEILAWLGDRSSCVCLELGFQGNMTREEDRQLLNTYFSVKREQNLKSLQIPMLHFHGLKNEEELQIWAMFCSVVLLCSNSSISLHLP